MTQSIDLGEDGLIPLEVRFQHNPDSTHGFVGAALSSTMWHCHKADGAWQADNIIAVPSVELEGWPIPGAGADHRSGAVDGRSLPVLLELAARRRAAV